MVAVEKLMLAFVMRSFTLSLDFLSFVLLDHLEGVIDIAIEAEFPAM